jgi:hypothetical protein
MSIPGFAGEASLYRSSASYYTTGADITPGDARGIVPALPLEALIQYGACRQKRPSTIDAISWDRYCRCVHLQGSGVPSCLNQLLKDVGALA